MIIIYRYPTQKVVLPTFRDLIKTGNLEKKFNILDSEIIKRLISEPKSEIDMKVKYHIDNGLLMSDAYFVDLLFQEWNSEKINIIVDFPRNIEQINIIKFYLEQKNEVIEKIIYYKIEDTDKIYEIAQNNYGKYYDSSMKDFTITHMNDYTERTESIIEKLDIKPITKLNILDENIDYLK